MSKQIRKQAGEFIKANGWRAAAIIEGLVIILLLVAAQ